MDLALGAMGSLLPKLGELLSEEYKMQTNVKQDVEAFSRELASMRAALQRVVEVPREQLDPEVKLWAGNVRELSYDMEDIVDSLLVRVKSSRADADMDVFKELVTKMKSLFKKGKARRQIATAIKDIKEQVQDVAARHQRYFIIIDDIWDISAWDSIKFAFMNNDCGSRIITTTRNLDVSKACCCLDDELIHKMKPLSEGDSQNLFYKRIFASESRCPPHFDQVSRDILKKCGGVPLAIITLASYLANNQKIKPEAEWHDLLKSIGHGLTNGGNVEQMKKILLLSYYDLPSHLKTCLLYLSIFPEDYEIDRDRLIRRWIAEGLIQGSNLYELGRSYFNELMNRSMIQQSEFDLEGEAGSCRVHDIMLDLICDLASEENFVTIMDTIKVDTPLKRKVRRLSVQKADLANTRLATSCISQVRSITIFSPVIDQMLPISRFEILRVLDLEGFKLEGSGQLNLSCIGDLLQLRYLGLRNTHLDEIPRAIGKLLLLQTLDLRGINANQLPASVIRLKNLMFLYIYDGYQLCLPAGYRNLTSLIELMVPCIGRLHPEELRYLTELRKFRCELVDSSAGDKIPMLLESLDKLHKLQCLSIHASGPMGHELGDWVPSSPQLRVFRFTGWYKRMPTRISSSAFPLLSCLIIRVRQVRPEDIQVIGALPALCTLNLESDQNTPTEEERASERSFVLSPDAFPCATKCMLRNVLFAPYMFTQGAMPMVRELQLSLLLSDILTDVDWEMPLRNLPLLKDVCLEYYYSGEYNNRVSEAKAAVERVATNHPNPLRFTFNIWIRPRGF